MYPSEGDELTKNCSSTSQPVLSAMPCHVTQGTGLRPVAKPAGVYIIVSKGHSKSKTGWHTCLESVVVSVGG